ncbi:MAG: Cys-tRNA(Pro) deacylase, partial [Aeromicrobium sp.]
GYVLGGISPLGQKKRHVTVIDESIFDFATVLVSAGKRGMDIELRPADLVKLTHAQVALVRTP